MDSHTINLLGALAIGSADLQERAMGETGLAGADLAALLAAFTRPASTVGDVAVATGLSHSGAVRVVDRLSDAGLLVRDYGDDRREVAIHCTIEGKRIAKQALALRRAALSGMTQHLTAKELATFGRLAGKMLFSLPEARQDAWRICRLCEHGVCRGADCPVGSAVA